MVVVDHEGTEAFPVVVPVHLRLGNGEVRLFTTLTTLRTPVDVTAQQLRIESYFPADDGTDRWLKGLTAKGLPLPFRLRSSSGR